jgi:hypothetical protein
MAAQAGAGANLDPLVGPAAVVIRSLSAAPVALRLSMCSKAANGPRPGRQPRPIDGLVYPARDGKEVTDTKEKWERFAKCAMGTHGGWVLAHVCPPTKDQGEKRIQHLTITLQEYNTLQEGTFRQPRTCWTVIPSPLVSPPIYAPT